MPSSAKTEIAPRCADGNREASDNVNQRYNHDEEEDRGGRCGNEQKLDKADHEQDRGQRVIDDRPT